MRELGYISEHSTAMRDYARKRKEGQIRGINRFYES